MGGFAPRVKRVLSSALRRELTYVLIGSIALRLAALVFAVVLLRRLFSVPMVFLASALLLMTGRQVMGLREGDDTSLGAELSSLFVSLMALGTVFFLARVLREKEASEQALRSSEGHFRSLVESAIDIVAVLDAAGRFLYLSPSVERVLGYRPSELLGRLSLDLVVPADRAIVAEVFAAALRTPGEAHGVICRLQHKRGDIVMIQSRGSVLLTPEGEKHGLLNMRDVSGEQRAEAEKQQLELELARAQKLRTLGTLAGGIAHDFNNVLTPILGSAELARATLPLHSGAREHVDNVIAAAERAKQLVERVLAFARKSDVKRRPVDLAGAVKDALALLRTSLPRNVQLATELDEQAGSVLADPIELFQVLLNLGTNAAQAMSEAGGSLLVTVRRARANDALCALHPALRSGQWLALSVKDSGAGMDAATLARAFEPFFSTRRGNEGSGLGLSIVQSIVRGLGGVIDVQSEPAAGTRVELWLPAHGEQAVQTVSGEPGPGEKEAASQGRLLLVDDEPAVLSVCKELLAVLGYEVTAVADAHEALALITAAPERFDAMVTDQSMPKMTGVELTQAVWRVRPALPVVLTTGYVEGDLLERLGDSPVVRIVGKPYSLHELSDALAQLMRAR
jgi:PAS domain S-box-containing protein